MTHLLYFLFGPAGSAKTLALYDRFRAAPRSAWLVPATAPPHPPQFDHLRAADVVAGTPFLTPAISSLTQLAARWVVAVENVPRLLGAADRRVFVAAVIAEVRKSAGFGYFQRVVERRGFLDQVIGFLDELLTQDIALEDLPTFVRMLTQAPEVADRADRARLVDLEVVFNAYLQACERRNVVDCWGLLHRVARDLPDHPEWLDGVPQLLLDGFAAPLGIEERFLRQLMNQFDLAGGGDVCLALDDERLIERGRRDVSAGAEDDAWMSDYREEPVLPPLPPWVCRLLANFPSRKWPRIPERVAAPPLPAGREHAARTLFQVRTVRTKSAAGIEQIRAPGEVGELRLVARSIVGKMLDGVPARRIVVTGVRLDERLDALRDRFTDYRIPVALRAELPLSRQPWVKALFRCLQLPEANWDYALLLEILCDTTFQPVGADAATLRRARGVLMRLGETQGRERYRTQLERYAHYVGGPGDAVDQGAARRFAAEVQRALPFFERFFAAWDRLLSFNGSADAYLATLEAFVHALGLDRSWQTSPDDFAAWQLLRGALRRTAAFGLLEGAYPLRLHALQVVADSVMVAAAEAATGVRVVPLDEAEGIDCDVLYLVGMAERTFPDLGAPPSILQEFDRGLLRKQGLRFAAVGETMLAERKRFLRLLRQPRRTVVLSYAAVDAKGQKLLPSSFLNALTDLFEPGALATTTKRMPIDGFLLDRPYGQAELRNQWAARYQADRVAPNSRDLAESLQENLVRAKRMAEARFRSAEFTPYDGILATPEIQHRLAERFGADHIFSPTALELYQSCPFRYMMKFFLRLAPLEAPSDELEHAQRGLAVHQMLEDFHGRQRRYPQEESALESVLLGDLNRAVARSIDGTSSEAARQLWRIEERRLERWMKRYPDQWKKLLEQQRGGDDAATLMPETRWIEVDFGMGDDPTAADTDAFPPLVLEGGLTRVRIGGRIDRIDVADTPDGTMFWIIDYKSGKSSSYTMPAIAQYRVLQLPLYALAVEQILLRDERPAMGGLVYWFVTSKQGAKVFANPEGRKNDIEWHGYKQKLTAHVVAQVEKIREGRFPLMPIDDTVCTACDYRQICRIGQARGRKSTATEATP